MHQVKSPILFLIFNRPEETLKVFNSIREAKPLRLYISQDGPRSHVKDEFNLCEITREILKKIDWNCELKTKIRNHNLGCKIAVSEAISWFFENEEEGIILEDDCLPCNDFFKFCDELLVKYRHDNRIGHISGSNFQFNNKRGTSDYYFSRLYNVWGWATWKRVWLKYDINMENLEEAIKNDFLNNVTDNLYHKDYLYKCFEATKSNKINTWDYQYTYSNSIQGLLSIFPNNNMISNIGFNEKGTHTLSNNHPFSNLSHVLLPKNLIHPNFFISNKPADEFTLSTEIPSLFVRIFKKYRGILIIKIKSFFQIN